MAEEQQVTKEPQQVTTKNPNKVKAVKRLAEYNHRKRKEKKAQGRGVNHWSCYSCWSDRQPWLLHLSNQERTSHHQAGCKHQQRSTK